MSSTSHAEYTADLEQRGYLPMGRYEHTIKADKNPVLFMWYHPQKRSTVIVESHTDNERVPTEVIAVYEQKLVLATR